MNYLVSKMDKAEIVVEQAEDEIAAINMAIGASRHQIPVILQSVNTWPIQT